MFELKSIVKRATIILLMEAMLGYLNKTSLYLLWKLKKKAMLFTFGHLTHMKQ